MSFKKASKRILLLAILLLFKMAMTFLSLFNKTRKFKRILIMQLYFIGDVISITPAIKEIKKRYPDYEIDIWLQKNSKDVLKNNPDVSDVYVDPTPCTKINSIRCIFQKFQKNFYNILAMYRKNYEIVIDYSGYFDTALVSIIVGRWKRLGLSCENIFKIAYTYYLPFSFNANSKLRYYYLDLLKYIDISYSKDDMCYNLYPSNNDIMKIENMIQSFKSNLITIAPFAGWKSKEWPLKRFLELAKRMVSEFPVTVLFIGGLADESKIQNSSSLNDQIISLAGKTTLLESSVLIKRSALFIGLDSSMCYIAESFKTPSLILYGSTNSSLLQTGKNRNIHVIKKQLLCSPEPENLYCGDNTILYNCPNKFGCMREICVDEVYEIASRIINISMDRPV